MGGCSVLGCQSRTETRNTGITFHTYKMEWVLRSPQIHSTFSNLGFVYEDGYHVNENCNAALETILHNVLTEDKYLRTYRRSISFGQNIKKDLIPLLIHAKDDNTIELLIRILVNLTVPIECLLSVDVISKNDFGRHTIFEINNLLASTKVAFTDHRATKAVIDFLKKNVDFEQKSKLPLRQCTNISNSLLLLRNILHIPEELSGQNPNYNGSPHTVQNQILWNIFSQSIDKVLIKLMTIPDASKWAVTIVQFIALLYKDQHVVTLHKFLNLWLEASLSESSEDNESNTSPPNRGSDDSSPLLTDPTSDSSDTGASGKSNDEQNSMNIEWDASSMNNSNKSDNRMFSDRGEKQSNVREKNDGAENTGEVIKLDKEKEASCSCGENSKKGDDMQNLYSNGKTEKIPVISETSDCGYGTQIENQESISTSSNEDELPTKKPVHQKPHNPKQKTNNKVRSGVAMQERKRKKIVKRGKANIINVQGLSHKTPTDDDISNVLKEFTVDFLLKGYNPLMQTLYKQILTNVQMEIDTSHFFWLVTYFLKFATQIELDLEHVHSVISYDVVSYLTAEGVNLCEQFELAIKLDGNDLKPSIRRLHLVVTAIREIIQAIDVYKKFSHIRNEDQKALVQLQIKMCEAEDLRSLFVLLLRHYNPKYHTKQYLQDLIVTNHILLMFLDSAMKLPEYNGSTNMMDHIRQFATSKMMYQYGLMLEGYLENGEFVNDCIFTLMHHVGGELDSLITLFQPKILKTFTSIWESEFEICDDWSDLIEYVINTFIKKPHSLRSTAPVRLNTENFDDDNEPTKPSLQAKPHPALQNALGSKKSGHSNASSRSKNNWTDDELSSLSWNYMQCSSKPDVVGEIIRLLKEDGIIKSRGSVIKELFNQNLINEDEFEILVKGERERNSETLKLNDVKRDDEIRKMCEQITLDGKSKFLDWVQNVLLETCFAKIYIRKQARNSYSDGPELKSMLDKLTTDSKILSAVSYHSLRILIRSRSRPSAKKAVAAIQNQAKQISLQAIRVWEYWLVVLERSVPLVPWNCLQAAVCKDLKFLRLLHKLGFHMPVDSGKLFIRIPHYWTAEYLFNVASKISSIDKSKLKFSINDISDNSISNSKQHDRLVVTADVREEIITMVETSDNFYQIHKQKHLATMVNFTPMPGSSFNSGVMEIENHNWLEVVKKSQEYKITLDLESGIIDDELDNESDVVMEHKDEDVSPSPLFAASFPMPPPMPVLMPPTMPVMMPPTMPVMMPPTMPLMMPPTVPPIMSVTQEPSQFISQVESESCSHSVCETASVASDLTRMYVSDEDEKPDVMPAPVAAADDPPPAPRERSPHSENGTKGKRVRVQFYSPF